MTAKNADMPSGRVDRRPLADRVKDLDGFVSELRGRLDRGDYVNLGPVDLGAPPPLQESELAQRIMLADWDHFDNLTPKRRDDYAVAARRLKVLADLHALRQRLDQARG
jgi:hypothetical protein